MGFLPRFSNPHAIQQTTQIVSRADLEAEHDVPHTHEEVEDDEDQSKKSDDRSSESEEDSESSSEEEEEDNDDDGDGEADERDEGIDQVCSLCRKPIPAEAADNQHVLRCTRCDAPVHASCAKGESVLEKAETSEHWQCHDCLKSQASESPKETYDGNPLSVSTKYCCSRSTGTAYKFPGLRGHQVKVCLQSNRATPVASCDDRA